MSEQEIRDRLVSALHNLVRAYLSTRRPQGQEIDERLWNDAQVALHHANGMITSIVHSRLESLQEKSLRDLPLSLIPSDFITPFGRKDQHR